MRTEERWEYIGFQLGGWVGEKRTEGLREADENRRLQCPVLCKTAKQPPL